MITGGWAAKELTEKGMEVLLLERGRPVGHGVDYITEHKAPWQVEYRGRCDNRRLKEEQYLQSQAGPVNEYNAHFFVNDRQNPYTFDADKPFLWIRGYHLGGGSITWGRGIGEAGLGAELKNRLRTPGRWRMFLVAFGEMLPRRDNYITLDPSVTDAWGLPVLRMHCTLGENEQAMRRDMKLAGAGACMTSAACQNPSLTYMALTARACDYAVEATRRKEL